MFRSGLARSASFARNLAVPNNCKCIGKVFSESNAIFLIPSNKNRFCCSRCTFHVQTLHRIGCWIRRPLRIFLQSKGYRRMGVQKGIVITNVCVKFSSVSQISLLFLHRPWMTWAVWISYPSPGLSLLHWTPAAGSMTLLLPSDSWKRSKTSVEAKQKFSPTSFRYCYWWNASFSWDIHQN